MAFNSEDVRPFKLKSSKYAVLRDVGPVKLLKEPGRLYDTFYVVVGETEVFRTGFGSSDKEIDARALFDTVQRGVVPIMERCHLQTMDIKTLKSIRDFRNKNKGNILHWLMDHEAFWPALEAFCDKERDENAEGLTPLMYGIRRGKESWAKLIEVLPSDILKQTFLKVCGDEKYKDVLIHFLKFSRITVYEHLYDGLHEAIECNNIKGAKILLDPRNELDLGFATNPDDENVFHLASRAADAELLKLLFKKTKPGQEHLWRAVSKMNTPIDLAALNDPTDTCMKLFIEHNISASENTVLQAFLGNRQDTLKFLFQTFPIINENQGLYRTILGASEDNTYECSLVLLKEGVDPNPPGDMNYLASEPPLHVACKKGLLDLMKALVVFGANIHAKYQNSTAYEVAKQCGHEYMLQNLRDIGAHEPLDYECKQVPPRIDPYRDHRFCDDFLDGFCERDDNCPKLHGELDEDLPPLEVSGEDMLSADETPPGEGEEEMKNTPGGPERQQSITDWLVNINLPEYISPLHQHAINSVNELMNLTHDTLRSVFVAAGVKEKDTEILETSLTSMSRQNSQSNDDDSKMEDTTQSAGSDIGGVRDRSAMDVDTQTTQSTQSTEDSPPGTATSMDVEQVVSSLESQASLAGDYQHTFDAEGPINILCCDGGGIRGLVTLELLCEIERRIGVPIENIFHFVAGTSTGGILASSVGLWPYHSLTQCRQIYFNFAKDVFQGARIYPRDTLISLVESEFKRRRMMPDKRPPRVRVAVVAADSSFTNPETFIFRNYKPELGSYPGTTSSTVIEAICATSAAPSYFQAYDVSLDGARRTFLDGGMLHNNPTIVALEETAGQKTHCVVSFGTGSDPQKNLDMKLDESLSNMDFSNKMNVGLALYRMRTKDLSTIADYFVNCVAGSDVDVATARRWVQRDRKGHFFRFQPDFGDDQILLDETKEEVLIDMCWRTRVFVYKNRGQFKQLCEVLKQNLRKPLS